MAPKSSAKGGFPNKTTNIKPLIDGIWAEFRKAGITDDITVIGQVADRLLSIQGKPSALLSVSSKSELDQILIEDLLRQAIEQNQGNVGDLFDRYVLFRLDRMLPGGRYPTPRHIIQLIIAVTETTGHQVADFACGSAGMLVHSAGKELIGAEISPEWAQLAQANVTLHDQAADIRTGNALRVIRATEHFERIIMNPPFGEKIKSEYGSRSETALNALALAHLENEGKAALLTPTGLLFSSSQNELKLRQQLVDEHHLEAVIALPSDSFQPFSTSQTHCLVVSKVQINDQAKTWFLRPSHDGYVSGRGRDLTESPQQPNDLILAEKAVLSSRKKEQTNNGNGLFIEPILDGENLLGLMIQPGEQALLVNTRYLPGTKSELALILFEMQEDNNRKFLKYTLQEDSLIEVETDQEKLIRKRLGLTPTAALPPADVFQNRNVLPGKTLSIENALVCGLVVKTTPNEKAQLFGVAVTRQTLRDLAYALEPDRFVRIPEVSPELRIPQDILRDVHTNQQKLTRRINNLAGWLATDSRQQASIPSPILESGPFGQLDETQHQIWEIIESMVENTPEPTSINTGIPFTPDDILQQNPAIGEGAIQLSLQIFEAMGLIVPVTYKHLVTDELLSGYRRVQEIDIYKLLREGGDE